MMLTKIYFALWMLIVLSAALLLVLGLFTEQVMVFYGFVVFGMVFMGMMSVLPSSIHDNLLKH